MRIGVGEFKARCLALIEDLHLHGGEVLLTKRGRPMARVRPWEDESAPSPAGLTVRMVEDWK